VFNWVLASAGEAIPPEAYVLRIHPLLLLRIRATPGLKNAEHRRIRATPGLVLRILQASPKDWMRRKNAEYKQAVGLDAEEPVNTMT
jgi:hypothetical protein